MISRLRGFVRAYRVMRYLLTGVSTSLLDLALFSLLAVVVAVPEVLANVASTLVTVCISYLINQTFVFNAEKRTWGTFFSFIGHTLFTGLVLQSAVIWALAAGVNVWLPGANQALVLPGIKLIAMLVGAVCNYLEYRLIFTRKSDCGGQL